MRDPPSIENDPGVTEGPIAQVIDESGHVIGLAFELEGGGWIVCDLANRQLTDEVFATALDARAWQRERALADNG
jgi:hypothetical protein